MTEHQFFSIRTGKNKNADGFDLGYIKELFARVYSILRSDGYFDQSFGWYCVDMGDVDGSIKDIDLEILLKIRKKNLWPIDNNISNYSEDDLFDMIEFLHLYVSKPIEGTMHGYGDCGMHWETFNKSDGQLEFRTKVNELLAMYRNPYELNENGMILQKAERGFEAIFQADIPTSDNNIAARVASAIVSFRRHGSTIDSRRQAVRDLADVLEYIKPQAEGLLTQKDEKDLFNIANNFGLRHHNDKQKTNYDAVLWLSWMFYYYLATIHVLLRKIEKNT